jgi:hypothetical protein
MLLDIRTTFLRVSRRFYPPPPPHAQAAHRRAERSGAGSEAPLSRRERRLYWRRSGGVVVAENTKGGVSAAVSNSAWGLSVKGSQTRRTITAALTLDLTVRACGRASRPPHAELGGGCSSRPPNDRSMGGGVLRRHCSFLLLQLKENVFVCVCVFQRRYSTSATTMTIIVIANMPT